MSLKDRQKLQVTTSKLEGIMTQIIFLKHLLGFSEKYKREYHSFCVCGFFFLGARGGGLEEVVQLREYYSSRSNK